MSNSNNAFKAMIEAKRSGQKVAAIDFVAHNPEIPAVLSKLVSRREKTPLDREGNRVIDQIDQSSMRTASGEIAQKAKDAQTVLELFPEIELCSQILISSIISPKDMYSTEINFRISPKLKVSPLASTLIGVIKEHFEKSYKIESLLTEILQETLFQSGSYAVAVIPENSVDELINGQTPVSMESIQSTVLDQKGKPRPLGILGNGHTHTKGLHSSLESMFKSQHGEINPDIVAQHGDKTIALGVQVTDNPDVMKLPSLIERVRQERIDTIFNQSTFSPESYHRYGSRTNELNDYQLSSLFYKNKYKPSQHVKKVKSDEELGRSMIGEPLVMKLPSESVLPVYTPGNVKKHIGYYVLLDLDGNPLSSSSVHFQEGELRARMGMNNQMDSYLLNRAAKQMGVNDCSKVSFRDASRVYADIVEADLLARLRNGIVGPVVSIAKNEEIYRIMLARSLMQQGTQLLYIPTKLMTYFAFKYNDYGVGVSLLDKMRNINSMRAMLLFSQTMAQVKNSIGRRKATIKLDPDMPDPQKMIENTIHSIAQLQQSGFPLGTLTAGDLVDWVNRSGMEYAFEGHPGLPDVAIDYSEHSTSYTEPNSDLVDNLRKSVIMGFGLSPEMVDNGFQSDFATTVVNNNILLAKRVMMLQDEFVPMLSDYFQKLALNNAYVFDSIKTVIKDNLKKIAEIENIDPIVEQYKDTNPDLLVHLLTLEFLSNFEVVLAKPDAAAIKNQAEAFDAQEMMLDKAINYFLDSSIHTSAFAGEEVSQRIDEVKGIVKAYYMRKWMTDNHILNELGELATTDDDGQPLIDMGALFKTHVNAVTKSVVGLIARTQPVAKAADRDIANITGGEDLGESEASSGSDYSSSDTDSSDDSSDDPFASDSGSDDFGLDETGDDSSDSGGEDDLPSLDL